MYGVAVMLVLSMHVPKMLQNAVKMKMKPTISTKPRDLFIR